MPKLVAGTVLGTVGAIRGGSSPSTRTRSKLNRETIMHDIIQTVVAIAVFAGMGYAAWKQIPPEDPEIIAARKAYGKVK